MHAMRAARRSRGRPHRRRPVQRAPLRPDRRPERRSSAARSCSRRATRSPSVEAAVLSSLAGLVAMQGDFDEARHLYARAKRLWEELGLRFAVAGLTQVGGEIELLADDPAAAERELRTGAEILAAVGGNALQSALLARALAAQGEEAEAEELAHEAETAAGGREIQAEVIAAATRASVCRAARRPGRRGAARRGGRRRAPSSPTRRTSAATPSSMLATCLAAARAARTRRTSSNADARERTRSKGNLAALERLDGCEARRASIRGSGGVWSPRRSREGDGMSPAPEEPSGGYGQVATGDARSPRHATTPQGSARSRRGAGGAPPSRLRPCAGAMRLQMKMDPRWHGKTVRLQLEASITKNPGRGRRVPGLGDQPVDPHRSSGTDVGA